MNASETVAVSERFFHRERALVDQWARAIATGGKLPQAAHGIPEHDLLSAYVVATSYSRNAWDAVANFRARLLNNLLFSGYSLSAARAITRAVVPRCQDFSGNESL